MTIVEELLNKLENQNLLEKSSMRNDLLIHKKSLDKKKAYLEKFTNDYLSEKISAETYNTLAESFRKDLADLEEKKKRIERQLEDLQSETIITREVVYQALENFDNLFESATNEQKKLLIRAIIKKIEVEPNRKDIKNITFWFDYDDALLLSKAG